jgi:hypothetical protein
MIFPVEVVGIGRKNNFEIQTFVAPNNKYMDKNMSDTVKAPTFKRVFMKNICCLCSRA